MSACPMAFCMWLPPPDLLMVVSHFENYNTTVRDKKSFTDNFISISAPIGFTAALCKYSFYSRCIYVFTNLQYHIWTLISHWFDHHKLLHWLHAYQIKGGNFNIFLLYFIVVKA
jgi:hypothetical protein